MAVLAAVTALLVLLRGARPPAGREFWLFSRTHEVLYRPEIAQWNAGHAPPVVMTQLSSVVLERRLQSAFFSGTPAAALVEVERRFVPRLFSGPLEDVGFDDLTDRIRAEGLDRMILPASFSPWTSRGRIFGLPHDVHPVMLAYRADITEAAGIDLSRVQTWEEFFALLAPLKKDRNGDGLPDHVPLAFALSSVDQLEALLLQGGGSLFDRAERPSLNTERNAELVAGMVSWVIDPARRTAEAPEFSAAGNRLKLEGFVIASLMPDWLAETWRTDMPGLHGRIKLMPLPAWRAGGLRTTVLGGTMLGLPRMAGGAAENWELAKFLYLGRETAVQLFEKTGIITPVSAYWDDPVFDRSDAFFCGQKPGRLFIEQAVHVPARSSSALNSLAMARLADAAIRLRDWGKRRGVWRPEELLPEARRFLDEAQASVERQQRRNIFLVQ